MHLLKPPSTRLPTSLHWGSRHSQSDTHTVHLFCLLQSHFLYFLLNHVQQRWKGEMTDITSIILHTCWPSLTSCNYYKYVYNCMLNSYIKPVKTSPPLIIIWNSKRYILAPIPHHKDWCKRLAAMCGSSGSWHIPWYSASQSQPVHIFITWWRWQTQACCFWRSLDVATQRWVIIGSTRYGSSH